MQIMSFGQRLAEERKKAGFASQEAFGDKLSVSFTTVSRWEKDQTPMPSDKLMIAGELGVNIVYVLTGEIQKNADIGSLEEYKPNKNNSLSFGTADSRQFVSERKSEYSADYAYIPLYDVDVSAGHGCFASEENILTHLAFTRYSLQKRGLEPSYLACVNGKGDSMSPSIEPDDTLMIDMRHRNADGGVFVFRHGESYFVKRLILESNSILVISDNQIYRAWSISPNEDFEIIGKKVWIGSWE